MLQMVRDPDTKFSATPDGVSRYADFMLDLEFDADRHMVRRTRPIPRLG